jgi:hypothetical protein
MRVDSAPVTPHARKEREMLQQLTASVRRLTTTIPRGGNASATPLVRLGDGSDAPVAVAQTDIGMLRGVTDAAADVSECTCPEQCERDHANE